MRLVPAFRSTIIVLILLILSVSMDSCKQNVETDHIIMDYPEIKATPASDNYFGKVVEDKYRILENVQNKNVEEWLHKEKTLTDSILNKISYRDSLKSKIEDAIYSTNIRGGFPRAVNKKLFYARLFLKERIEKIFYRDSLTGQEVEIFDTHSVDDSTTKYDIYYFEPSYDGKYLACGLSPNGSEMSVIKIIDVESKKILPETIERAAYGNPSWVSGQVGFFYTQLKDIKSASDEQTLYEDGKVKFHVVGSDPKNDREIISHTHSKDLVSSKLDIPFLSVFPNTDMAVVSVARGSTQYISLYCTSLNNLIPKHSTVEPVWKQLCTPDEMTTSFAVYGHAAYALCFQKNPNGCLKKYELEGKSTTNKTLIEAKNEVLEDLIQTQNYIYLKRVKNGFSQLTRIDVHTGEQKEVELPFTGYITLKPPFPYPPFFLNSSDLFFMMESWNKELNGYVYNPKSDKVLESGMRATGKYGNPADIVVKEVEITSHDGVSVPLSIIYSKNVSLDGNNPTLLEAYGSYGISMNSHFDLGLLTWLNAGGIYAVAHVRGGGEKGNDWYKAGYKANKPNTWKDFIACAEYLIENKYTSSAKLAAKGVSAGGIPVGMAVIERPELFKAALLQVSALNSLRYENTRNNFTIPEFGTTKDSIEFNYLYAMDIYHNIKDDVQYPSLLITGEVNDALVDIWQSAKAAARFQEVSKGKHNVVLFKVGDSGHNGGGDRIKDELDNYSFLFWQLNDPKFKLK
jgi:prolyl oligopeptidase